MSLLTASVLCLALNVYHEAGIDPIEGQLAVALVTLNRTTEKKDICKTVFEPNQFSWTIKATDKNGKLKPEYKPKGQNWEKAKFVAQAVINGQITDFTKGSTHFYANYIKQPKWAKHMEFCGKWGTHLFFKVKKEPIEQGRNNDHTI